MFVIVTALRGNHDLTARWIKAAKGSSAQLVLVAVNNDECDAACRAEGFTTVPVTVYQGSDETERVNHIAQIYAQMIRTVAQDRILLWDDDVLPPFKGIEMIMASMDEVAQERGIAGIVSVYPFNNPQDKETAVLFWKPYQDQGAHISSIPPTGRHKVWGGGTGFSLWKTAVLKQTIPWTTAEVDGYVPGWDRDLAIKLAAMKARTLVDGAIRCRHDNLPR